MVHQSDIAPEHIEKNDAEGETADTADTVVVDGRYTRRQVRSLTFHLLYAMEEHDYTVPLSELVDDYNDGFELEIPEDGEIVNTAQQVIQQRHQLDDLIVPYLEKWRLDRLGVCTRLILRLALWEFIYTDNVAMIIINEAIELSKGFAEKDAYRFVNGVLDKVMHDREAVKERAKACIQ